MQARTTAASKAASALAARSNKNKCEVVDDRYPGGGECYNCYDVRRKFYPGKPQDQLNTDRQDDSKVDDDFNDKRHDLLSGEGKYKGKVWKICTIEKGEQNFDREYVSGTSAQFWDFASKRKLKAKSDDELITGEAGFSLGRPADRRPPARPCKGVAATFREFR